MQREHGGRRPLQGRAGERERLHHTARLARAEGGADIDFAAVNRAALAALPSILNRWLPDGRKCGDEWVARNPTRHDRRAGSFQVNVRTGRWADFATAYAGGDPISLAAYLFGLTQAEAARHLGEMLGIR